MSSLQPHERHKVAPQKISIKRKNLTHAPQIDVNYEQLFLSSRDAIVFLNYQCIISATNPACKELSGYEPEELIGKCGFKLPFIKKAPSYKPLFLKVIQGGKVPPVELEITHKDGSTKFIEANASLCKVGNAPGLQVIIRDITQHKKKETELQKSQNAYQAILEHTGTATIVIEENMQISFVNRDFEKLSGYPKNEIIGQKNWFEFFDEADVPKMTRFHQLRRKGSKEAPRNYEATFIDKNGDKRFVFMTVGMISKTNQSVASILDITNRKKAESELMSSKKLMDDLIQSNPTPIYTVDTEGKVRFWNKALEELSGHNAKKMLGTTNHWQIFYDQPTKMIVDLLSAGERPNKILKINRYKNFRMSRTRHGAITGMKFFKNFNGEKKWLKFYMKPIYSSKGKIMGAIETIADVTPEKNAKNSLENRIRELEVLYKIAHRQSMNTPIKVIMSKIMKNLVLACDYIEPARARITLDGKTYSTFKKGEQFVKKIEDTIEVMGIKRGKVELGYVKEISNKDSFELEYEKKVIRVVADNIGKHIQNREMVSQHEKLVKRSVVGIFIVQNEKIQYANPRFLRLLKLKKQDVIGSDHHAVIPHCPCNPPKKSLSCRQKIRRSDGKEIYVEISYQPIRYGGKEAILGSIQDLTKIKNAQDRQQNFNRELKTKIAAKTKDLTIANNRLQSLNKLKDEFIAIASHELRSPLTSARGYLSFMLESETLNNLPMQERGFLINAYRSLEGLNHLINNILDVSKIEQQKIELHLEKVCIVKLIQKIISQLSMQCREKAINIELQPEWQNKKLTIAIDQMRIKQAVRNILDNAIKYSNANKTIRVNLKEEAGKLLIEIADEGHGISKRDLEIIFEKFKQANRPTLNHKSGSGLGLFIASKIIELHGGEINVSSQLNKGTVFKLSLPIK